MGSVEFDWIGAGVFLTGLVLALFAGLAQLRKQADTPNPAAPGLVLTTAQIDLINGHRDAMHRLGNTMDRLGDALERTRQTMLDVMEALERHRSQRR